MDCSRPQYLPRGIATLFKDKKHVRSEDLNILYNTKSYIDIYTRNKHAKSSKYNTYISYTLSHCRSQTIEANKYTHVEQNPQAHPVQQTWGAHTFSDIKDTQQNQTNTERQMKENATRPAEPSGQHI